MGKELMRSTEHFEELGATASCSLRRASKALTRRKEGEQPIELVLGDSWFGSVKAAVAQAKAGFECIFQIKTNHALFPKKQIEDILRDSPGGISVILEGYVEDVSLFCIGYKYNKKNTLFFVCTIGAGSTTDGKPYEMKWSDDHGNINIRKVSRPSVLSEFFKNSNSVDVHNHLRQYCLKLEKKWVTNDCWFRLTTTLMGMSTVDAYRLAKYHNFLPYGRVCDLVDDSSDEDGKNEMSMKRFAGILANQLLYEAYNLGTNQNGALSVNNEDLLVEPLNPNGVKSGGNNEVDGRAAMGQGSLGPRTSTARMDSVTTREQHTVPSFIGGKLGITSSGFYEQNTSPVSMMSIENTYPCIRSKRKANLQVKSINVCDSDIEADPTINLSDSDDSGDFDFEFERLRRARKNAICIMTDVRLREHSVVKLPSATSNGKNTKGKRYVKPRKCHSCSALSRVKCLECNKVYCYPIKVQSNTSGSCFCKHVNEVTKNKRKKRKVSK